MLVPYSYVSIELIDCILLALLALNAVLSSSSVNTLCFLVLNFTKLFFYEFFMIFSKTLHIKSNIFLIGSFYFQVELLLNNVIIFKFYFLF